MLHVLQENLSRGLSIVGRAVATRPTLPVLSHVLLKPDGALLRLAATDLETFVVCQIGARADGEDGALTVPARLFADLINSLPQERVDLDVSADAVHLACAENEADVRGGDAQEFPTLPEAAGGAFVRLPPDLLREMIAQVAFAAATDESRPVLTGVYVVFEGETLTMAAADGFRLAVREARMDAPVAEPTAVIVPAKALTELARVASEEEEPVEVYITPMHNRILFRLQGDAGANKGRVFGIDFTSQLIEGNFVNYRQIVPTSHSTRAVVERQAFIKALKTGDVFARIEAGKVDLDVNDGQITVSAVSAETGDCNVDLPAQTEGDAVSIAFNVQFLLDALGAMGSAQVALELDGGTRPGTLRPVGDDEYLVVVMPMHVRS